MLGEIVKTTDKLRYHAKAAETSGRNLAHVNDENYARQRILLREGSMHSELGGLNTSSLGHSGLEQARNPLLDKRLLGEFGESSALRYKRKSLFFYRQHWENEWIARVYMEVLMIRTIVI